MMYELVVYVAGPYRADTEWEVFQNIRRAEQASLALWRMGFVAVCPHKNTERFGGALPDSAWLAGDLSLLKRCDLLFLVEGWELSEGARGEHRFALENSIDTVSTLEEAHLWLNSRQSS